MKKLVLMVIVVVLIVVGFAFAAANTVPPTGAGDGKAVISGYDVYDVHYKLANDPTKLDAVIFTITTTSGTASPTTVKVKLVSNSNTWFECDPNQNYSWICPINGSVSVLEANELRVIAVQ